MVPLFLALLLTTPCLLIYALAIKPRLFSLLNPLRGLPRAPLTKSHLVENHDVLASSAPAELEMKWMKEHGDATVIVYPSYFGSRMVSVADWRAASHILTTASEFQSFSSRCS